MCGRYTQHRPTHLLAGLFSFPDTLDLKPRYNIAPTQNVLAVRAAASGLREGVLLRWGLVPSWSQGPAGSPLINARAETAATKPAFRAAMKARRCLVPANGCFEWKAESRAKVPHYFTAEGDEPFAFAGLWERWEGDGKVVESVAILTTEANELVRPVHDRMPVILPPDVWGLWLDPAVKEPGRLSELLVPYPAGRMAVRAVGPAVGSPRNDSPQCIEPASAVAVQRSLF